MASTNARQFATAFDAASRQIAFGIARGLTQVARIAADEATATLPTVFDRPTRFTQGGIGIQPARIDDPVATVFVKDTQAGYLMMQETGGTRIGRKGSPVNLPVHVRTNAYGNVPRGGIARMLADGKHFRATKGAAKTKHLQPGVYRRAEHGKRRDGSRGTKGALRHGGEGKAVGGAAAREATGLELMISFRKQAHYAARFGFVKTVERSVLSRLSDTLSASVAAAVTDVR